MRFTAGLLVLLPLVLGQNNTQASSASFSPTPVTTAVPSATASLNQTVPGQGVYPPLQPWCNAGGNDTFCPGVILQDVQLSGLFPDSKTFVDKPTNGTLNATLQAFSQLGNNITLGQLAQFVKSSFKGEGLELNQVPINGFVASPRAVQKVSNPLYKGWVSIVNSYWSLLIRETNQSAVCTTQCESSLIPLNHTIVVPGGRYREIYYWDTFWILEGLLKSELYTYATDVILNFMDFIDTYGFIPNGGRKYYLNRSQPPVFIQMLDAYVKSTGNTTILERALPLASEEMRWWIANRTTQITSPYTGITRRVYLYNVTNSAPRPEGYVEDYETAFGAQPALNEAQRGDLYAELASGAESGYDYAGRWCRVPVINVTDNAPALRTLNVRGIIPVDLNSLQAGNHALLARLYQLYLNTTATTNSSSNSTASQFRTNATAEIALHQSLAKDYSDAVLDLHWDPVKAWFYDFNLSSNARDSLYTPAGTFPLWQNITPTGLEGNNTAALRIASGARYLLGRYGGIQGISSLLYTGLNWDFPNSWPPHTYTSIKAFQTLGRVVGNASIVSNATIPFSDVVSGQLGLNETQLPAQDASLQGSANLTVPSARNVSWPLALEIEYANRYMQGAFCSWYSTGGSINGLLTQLPLSQLNATGSYSNGSTGVMFEKFNATDIDAAGGGGEYTVQVGFGWTNGVVLWIAENFGQYLPQPSCPLVVLSTTNSTTSSNSTSPSTGNSTMNGTAASRPANATSMLVVSELAGEGVMYEGQRVSRD
ncbi:Six-hairpin glycosidase-like protein [Dioszegia hungarica]|uniref:Trehalase n=1 Tax=Dioszegia hungarica TaxID=4972 RepID=A0AA38HAH7_9TREE|nr:Six-hairpin glycosidase-like protein [Dioszegia hungarica]KAI9637637.1 Six-hairpin glycosidase-like protein [Dioszegia hungarica]